MSISYKIFVPVLMIFSATFVFLGCGQDQAKTQQINPTKVKIIKALKTDAPIQFEYSGQVIGKGEIKVQSKIAGKITDKYIRGGQNVEAGQPLYKIDSRQYEIAILQAEAQLAKARTNLNNAQTELDRDEKLYSEGAISEQVLTNQQTMVDAQKSDVALQQALLSKAQEDLSDATIYAPMSGRLSIDDVPIGTYVNPGSTNLVTISNVDPILVQISISESEYLKVVNADRSRATARPVVSLNLADGTEYPYTGEYAEADNSMADNTGTLVMRFTFPNPDNVLKPGMYARLTISGINILNAVLVPERAIQQLLGESFVLVANSENKSEVRTVKLGEKIGSYYVVTEGIKASDMVIVEGLTRLRDNMPVESTEVTPNEMGFSLQSQDKLFDSDK